MMAIPICYTPYGIWHAYPDRHTPAQAAAMTRAAISRGYTLTQAAAAILAAHEATTRCKTQSRGVNMIKITDYADAHMTDIADAINTAVAEGFALNTHADSIADEQLDTSEDYAVEVAAVDASLVYLTGGGPLDEIDDDTWVRTCGNQTRAEFAFLAIDNGETIADSWADAQLVASQVHA